jgi:hypothetical protein
VYNKNIINLFVKLKIYSIRTLNLVINKVKLRKTYKTNTHSSKGEGVNLVINKVNFFLNLQKKKTHSKGEGALQQKVTLYAK